MTTSDTKLDLTHTHEGLTDTYAARRYFRKFERITGHLTRVAGTMQAEGRLSKTDVNVISEYLQRISFSFQALGNKYLMTGRDTGQYSNAMVIDRVASGFPVYSEFLTMANDAQQAERHLRNMPNVDQLKDQMVQTIVGDQKIPTKLQFALSQRLYYNELLKGDLFWAQNDPAAIWHGTVNENTRDTRRQYLLHWAVLDSQVNLPVIYLMEVEDTGREAFPRDQRRWPEAQRHLMAQSVGGLKLVTIAKGFDEDFDDLHPKRLRRIHVGPMYSSAFTRQIGPIRGVLEQARAPEGEDWTLAWTLEELESVRVTEERKGWFGTVEREIFALDPFSGRGADTGATRTERSIILPQRPYQALAEQNPPGFHDVRKFVVSPNGRVFSYR